MADIAELKIRLDTKEVKQGNKDLDDLSSRSSKAESSTKSLASSFASMRSAIPVAGIGLLATAMVKASDTLTKFTAQLKNATATQNEFNQAFDNVRRIATSAQSPIEAVGSTYARLSNALRDLKVTQDQVAQVTETLALGLKVNGSSAEEAASAMLQLSQSFGSGKMQGDEFRSAMETMPSLMREVAKTMGVNIGELKSLSSEGKITSEVLLKTFSNPQLLASLQKQAEGMRTVGGTITEAKNEMVLFLGEMAKRTGIVDGFNFVIGAGTNTLKGFNDQLATGKIRLEGFLPAYAEYRKKMDGELKKAEPFEFAPTINSQGGKFNLGEFTSTPEVEVKKLTEEEIRAQDEKNKRLKEARDKLNAERLKDLQYQMDFELDMLEAKNKQEVEADKKAQDEIAMYKERRMAIEQKRANENFDEAQRLYKEQLEAEKKITEDAQKGFKDLERAIDGFARNSAQSMADFIFGTKTSFGDMVNSMLKDIARLALQKSIFDPIAEGISGAISGSETASGIGGWFKSLMPSFAVGTDYVPRDMVANIHQGERILTKDENKSYSSGASGGNVSVNVNVSTSGGSVDSNSSFGKQLGNAIKATVQAEMLKQKRQGGLLA